MAKLKRHKLHNLTQIRSVENYTNLSLPLREVSTFVDVLEGLRPSQLTEFCYGIYQLKTNN